MVTGQLVEFLRIIRARITISNLAYVGCDNRLDVDNFAFPLIALSRLIRVMDDKTYTRATRMGKR